MKRRGFFGLLGKVAGALTVSPLVARDMGDFEFRDTPSFPAFPEASEQVSETPESPEKPEIPTQFTQRPREPYTGDIRYNTETYKVEVYYNQDWHDIT